MNNAIIAIIALTLIGIATLALNINSNIVIAIIPAIAGLGGYASSKKASP